MGVQPDSAKTGRGRRGLRVLVVGGGIGGLCLAQGLRQAGIDVTVYEKDASPDDRRQGYRLRISPEGERALRGCLPRKVVELLVATSNERPEIGLAAYDENLVRQWAPEFDDPRIGDPRRIDAVDRITLRRVLLAGIEDIVRFGRRLDRYTVGADGKVTAWFDDGSRESGDVLVAADGAGSQVRAQCRPLDRPRDLGVRTVFSRIPMAAVSPHMPEELRDRFSYIIGSDGHHLGLMPMVFRESPARAARRLWPGLRLDDMDDYYMSVFNVHRDELGLDDAAFFALTGEDLRDLVLDRMARWHPALREICSHADPEVTFPVALRATMPIEPWEPGPVIPLGDAVHTMPPSGGVGANTAIRDADALWRALAAVDAGELPLRTAVAQYQSDMVRYAGEAVDLSLRIAQWSMKKIDLPPAATVRREA